MKPLSQAVPDPRDEHRNHTHRRAHGKEIQATLSVQLGSKEDVSAGGMCGQHRTAGLTGVGTVQA